METNKIKITIEIKYNTEILHPEDSNIKEKKWFLESILRNDKLTLYSNRMGKIGNVKMLKIIK